MTLNLLVLRCQNIHESKAFYEKLNINFVEEQHGKSPVHYAAEIGSLVLELYPLAKHENIDNCRLGFELKDTDNILKQLNVITSYQRENQWVHVVQDPDGRKVELLRFKENNHGDTK